METTKQPRCIECGDQIYYKTYCKTYCKREIKTKFYDWPGYEGSGFCSERCGFVWATKQMKHTRSLLDSIFDPMLEPKT